jgi:hypothetical protein
LPGFERSDRVWIDLCLLYRVVNIHACCKLARKHMVRIMWPAQVLTHVEYLAAKREGTLAKHADGSWGSPGEAEFGDRPLKRARQDVSAGVGARIRDAAQERGHHRRRCAIM